MDLKIYSCFKYVGGKQNFSKKACPNSKIMSTFDNENTEFKNSCL
jgi:hypothetical protein